MIDDDFAASAVAAAAARPSNASSPSFASHHSPAAAAGMPPSPHKSPSLRPLDAPRLQLSIASLLGSSGSSVAPATAVAKAAAATHDPDLVMQSSHAPATTDGAATAATTAAEAEKKRHKENEPLSSSKRRYTLSPLLTVQKAIELVKRQQHKGTPQLCDHSEYHLVRQVSDHFAFAQAGTYYTMVCTSAR